MILLRKHPSTEKNEAGRTRGRVLLGLAGAGSLLAALLVLGQLAPHAANRSGAEPVARPEALAAAPADMTATDIVLRVADLPRADRDRLYERNHIIDAAIATGMPIWRTFDPRDALAETLTELARYGVDVDDAALVNFDHIETTMPASRRAEVQALPFVDLVRNPVAMTPACLAADPNCHCPPDEMCSSWGVAEIGADIAHTAGVTGTGVKVAIIDDGFRNLNNTILAGELPSIPGVQKFLLRRTAGLPIIQNPGGGLDNVSIDDLEGEHGTAAAEVAHEVAPGASLYLYALESETDGTVTIGQMEKAIRSAAGDTFGGASPTADADVILVAMSAITTIRDPIAITAGGKNPFTDDIDFATAQGATVVVPSGNENFTQFEQTFTPCTDCDNGVDGICDEAENDTRYHTFDTAIFSDPINPVYWVDEYEFDFEHINHVTCYTATDAATPANFHVELRKYNEEDFLPSCPRDDGNNLVPGTDVALGGSFSKKNLNLYEGVDESYHVYSLSVYRSAGSETPRIRVTCTAGVSFLDYPEIGQTDYLGPSLSDLAVVTNAIAVGAHDQDGLINNTSQSSRGPTAQVSGQMKPDVAGPSGVKNFATKDWEVSFDEFFNGTSAAAAHVAGVVALMQHKRAALGLPPLTPAEVRGQIKDAAVDQGAIGDDPIYGAGLLQVPDSVLNPPLMDDLAVDFGGFGLWTHKNNATWTQINGNTAGPTATGDLDGNGNDELIVDFPGFGIWVRKNDTTWVQANGNQAESFATGDLDGTGKDDMVVDFGNLGIYVYRDDTSWQQLHTRNPDSIVACDIDGSGKDDLVVDFGGSIGVWVRRNDSSANWTQIHGLSPLFILCGDIDASGKKDLVINFGPSFGVYIYRNDLTFQQIHGQSPAMAVIADLDSGGKGDIVTSFGSGIGIYIYKNDSTWVPLHGRAPTDMTTGNYDGMGQDDVAIDFGSGAGFGLWFYKNDSTWVQKHGATTSGMASGTFDAL